MRGFGNDPVFMKDHRSKPVNPRRTIGHPIRAALNGKRKRIKSGARKP